MDRQMRSDTPNCYSGPKDPMRCEGPDEPKAPPDFEAVADKLAEAYRNYPADDIRVRFQDMEDALAAYDKAKNPTCLQSPSDWTPRSTPS